VANLYGVANAAGITALFNTIAGGNISCPAGASTAIMTSPVFIAPSQGFFFVAVWANLSVLFGASTPTSVSLAVGIGAGSAVNTVGTSQPYTPSAAEQLQFATFSATSQVAWLTPGSTITLYLNPFGQAVTTENAGSWATAIMFRAPDQ
jgi:hypothetical protein